MIGNTDTIAAVATARGQGALSIVRVSGTLTETIIRKCFETKADQFESHRAYHGYWKDPLTNKPIDEVLLLYFEPRRGFTGELSAEVICHGGTLVTDAVLKSILTAGARLARPGEFTFRAVMNGRIDLAQAESIHRLIGASSPRAVSVALRNLQGALSQEVAALIDKMTWVLANLEASIDFVSEDITPIDKNAIETALEYCLSKAKSLQRGFESHRLLDEGFRVVLAGRPNAGKSSLLNMIAGFERSIVTAIAGTTRDVIDVDLIVSGLRVKVVDTAGIRESQDLVERQGIQKAKEEIADANLIVYVVDAAAGFTLDEANEVRSLPSEKTVICFNKVDLLPKAFVGGEVLKAFGLESFRSVEVSALDKTGIAPIVKEIESTCVKASVGSEVEGAFSLRQMEALKGLQEALEKAKTLMNKNESPEFVSLELRVGLGLAKSILGQEVGDDVLDRVFKEFCIGK
ncbi:MAG: tRNA uridine-5-carboxymethylaminomethyl(34) synthesis GTPase MnmE [Oligoflexia bacterium]|nr:tRNA uridine-5-carboxymethylaminomethyl(34) synthesis GTPase MnmE [Oligoflexia bacterium]